MNESIWPDAQSTAELLSGARQGRAEAIEQLLSNHRESLRRIIDQRLDKRVAPRVDVSDVLQDVLIEVHRRLQACLDNPVLPFHLWIRQIARDRLIDAHRRHRVSAKRSVDRERRLEARSPNDSSTIEWAGRLMDPELTPAARATQRELAQRVQACMAQLDERDQDILLMRHFEQLSNQEVATVLELSEPAASMRYLRACGDCGISSTANPWRRRRGSAMNRPPTNPSAEEDDEQALAELVSRLLDRRQSGQPLDYLAACRVSPLARAAGRHLGNAGRGRLGGIG